MSWKLYLDDVRTPENPEEWVIAKSTIMAVIACTERNEMPDFMSLDHDLGEEDTTMRFLKELHYIWETLGSDPDKIPNYIVHSANPLGTQNIISFMESWKKSSKM